MAEVVLPRQTHLSMDMARNAAGSERLAATRSSHSTVPNPPFVFPMQLDTAQSASFSRNDTLTENDSGPPRTSHRSVPKKLSLNALPAFDFNPGAAMSSTGPALEPSPTRSQTRRTPPPNHTSGHRRGGSEFVGGDITNGGPVLISPSPTKSEGMPLPSSNSTVGPSSGRRGHAHRRSGAISSHDLSLMLKPSNDSRITSAPTTPSDPMFQHTVPPVFDRSISQPAPIIDAEDTAGSTSDVNMITQARTRVGFSDVIEVIPRPLSTISSETSSSMSTIRGNHSVTGSITSVISGGTPSSPSASSARLARYSHEQARPRANTSVSISRDSETEWEWDFSDADLTKRPSSAPVGDVATKGDMPRPISAHNERLHHSRELKDVSVSALALNALNQKRNVSGLHTNHVTSHSKEPPGARLRTSPQPRVTKRQQKVKSWAGSILSRRGRDSYNQQEPVGLRSPNPSAREPVAESNFSLEDVTFDEDTTTIIETPSGYPSNPKTKSSLRKLQASSPCSEIDSSSPILDLDVAIGPSDAPGHGPSFDDIARVVSAGRRMHSRGEIGEFSGPGMHYHRRTESAPEMDAVNRTNFGIPRWNSNPTMAEAIEEEEEDEEDEGDTGQMPVDQQVRQERNRAPGLGVNIVETDHTSGPIQRRKRRTVDPDDTQYRRSSKTMDRDTSEQLNDVEIVGAEEEPRFSVITKSSDESTITPTLSRDPLAPRPASAPIDCALSTPSLTCSVPETPSALSSPDYSETCFEGPRIHTAHSSITDRVTLGSSRAGEHGMGSVDDVPSLTSSASTTISAQPARFSSSANTCSSAERSSSVSAAVPPRTRPPSTSKRSSLASLSRLVGSSYNHSKLNIEECAPPDVVKKSEKKQGNRISRMMKFWKSKEKLSTT